MFGDSDVCALAGEGSNDTITAKYSTTTNVEFMSEILPAFVSGLQANETATQLSRGRRSPDVLKDLWFDGPSAKHATPQSAGYAGRGNVLTRKVQPADRRLHT